MSIDSELPSQMQALLLDGNSALGALVCGFFAAASVFAGIGVNNVAQAVVADLENVGANIFTDTTTGAKVRINFGYTHDLSS
jgi:hypothetical protein